MDHGVAIIAIEAVATVISSGIFAVGIKVAVDRFIKNVKGETEHIDVKLLEQDRIRVTAIAIASCLGSSVVHPTVITERAFNVAEEIDKEYKKRLVAAKMADAFAPANALLPKVEEKPKPEMEVDLSSPCCLDAFLKKRTCSYHPGWRWKEKLA